ncbi:hypothetical protein PQO01_02495 [Lentisphaera marina]|uniref:hypothetical protein n=1 Tax=Lentisphaera marina TaxID=1111041 RepID=UPI00236610E9|nr:hypothetical protein [Lentisphaera marina]MDD7983816.1 hypothetical protein [Lentisphaera marina]
MRAILFGVTGATGRELAQVLCEDDFWTEVYCPSRRPLDWTHSKLKVIDFNEVMESFDLACDAAFICIGTTVKQAGSVEAFRKVDFDLIFKICQWANNKSIPEVHLQSSMGADPHAKMNYMKVKGELEEAVKQIDIDRLTIYRPTLLCGAHRQDFRIAEELGYVVLKTLAAIFPALKKQQPVEVSSVARCMAKRVNQKNKIEMIESQEIAKYGMPPKRFLDENSLILKLLIIMCIILVIISQMISMGKLEQVVYALLTSLAMQVFIINYNRISLSKNEVMLIKSLEKSYVYLLATIAVDSVLFINFLSLYNELSWGHALSIAFILISSLLIKVYHSENIKLCKQFFNQKSRENNKEK